MNIPAGPNDLTAEWLTWALKQGGAIVQAKVAEFDAESLGDDKGFIGQIATIDLKYDQVEQGAPQKLIGKFSAAQAGRREHGRVQHIYEREVRFYQQIGNQVELPTPRCYYSQMDTQSGLHVVLLEDLSPTRTADRLAGITLAQARLALSEIARFHAAWWQSAQLDRMDWIPDLHQMHDFQQIEQRLPAMWERFQQMLSQPAPDLIGQLFQRQGRSLVTLGQALYLGPPRTLVHFDFQPANLFFKEDSPEDQLTVIDWQLMTRARSVTDVAYLLGENMLPSERRRNEMALLQLYHQTLLANGVMGYDFRRCLDDYRRSLLFRMVLIVFTVTHIPFTAEQRALHLEVLWPRNNAAILDLAAADLLEAKS